MINLTDTTFEKEVSQSSGLVMVDFWAPWCGPCKIMEPIVESIAKEYESKPIKIAKVNVDENQTISMQHGIMSIPTFLIFKDGQVVDQVVGGTSKEMLRGKIEKHLE